MKKKEKESVLKIAAKISAYSEYIEEYSPLELDELALVCSIFAITKHNVMPPFKVTMEIMIDSHLDMIHGNLGQFGDLHQDLLRHIRVMSEADIVHVVAMCSLILDKRLFKDID